MSYRSNRPMSSASSVTRAETTRRAVPTVVPGAVRTVTRFRGDPAELRGRGVG